jgi:hypothetical protein
MELGCFELFEQRPAGGIDYRGILEGTLCLRLDLSEKVRFVLQEYSNI